MPPPTILTTLPINSWAFLPVSITIPDPSLPTGIGLLSLGFIAPIMAFGTSIIILESLASMVLISPGPSNSPRSDGLIGVAST